MCKLVENSFRDVNIAFANQLSLICDKEGINVWELINLANRHPRVDIMQPGSGVGGHCIAIDPWFIVARDPENSKFISAARDINDQKPNWVISKIKKAASNFTAYADKNPTILCLGLTFKPDIDDFRGSPALSIASTLRSDGYKVIAAEPNISFHEDFEIVNVKDGIERADVIAILVKHTQFLDKNIELITA